MSINAYTGLQGSGKSYEVVRELIIPGVAAGRRVVTNIDGIDNEAIRAYVCEKKGVDLEKIGHVHSVTNEVVLAPGFFPTAHDDEQSIVRSGDLVAIDEAWRFWGTDSRISSEHRVFFREHRHFTHPETGAACDLVLMAQDISDLHRMLKVVIELSFRTHKAKGLGLNNVYTITMWEGYKQTAKGAVNDWTKTYDREIFPLYKSYAGEKQGQEEQSDKRQNVFNDKRLLFKIAFVVIAASFAAWRLYHYFHDGMTKGTAASPGGTSQAVASVPVVLPAQWRIVGLIETDGIKRVVLYGATGFRIESAVNFTGYGLSLTGNIDGMRVTRFTGQAPSDGKSKGIIP
jgi:zona occludens toxin